MAPALRVTPRAAGPASRLLSAHGSAGGIPGPTSQPRARQGHGARRANASASTPQLQPSGPKRRLRCPLGQARSPHGPRPGGGWGCALIRERFCQLLTSQQRSSPLRVTGRPPRLLVHVPRSPTEPGAALRTTRDSDQTPGSPRAGEGRPRPAPLGTALAAAPTGTGSKPPRARTAPNRRETRAFV